MFFFQRAMRFSSLIKNIELKKCRHTLQLPAVNPSQMNIRDSFHNNHPFPTRSMREDVFEHCWEVETNHPSSTRSMHKDVFEHCWEVETVVSDLTEEPSSSLEWKKTQDELIQQTETVVSDLTEKTSSSLEWKKTQDELIQQTEAKLYAQHMDVLKDKCKQNQISGVSKMKKHELVQALMNEFRNLCGFVREKKMHELKQLCKLYNMNIFSASTARKDQLCLAILKHCVARYDFVLVLATAPKKLSTLSSSTIVADASHNILQQPQQKQSLLPPALMEERKMKREVYKSIQDEREKQRVAAEQREKEKEKEKDDQIAILAALKLKEEKDDQKATELAALKQKKQAIPKQIRIIVWNHYIGEDIMKHKCLCCKKVTISNMSYDVGHVISEKNGGTHEINNLRPICALCNHSMGTENMIEFVVKYGLFIG